MMAIFVNLTGAALVLFVLYWFLLSKPKVQAQREEKKNCHSGEKRE